MENFIIFKFNKYFILVFKSVPLLLFTTKPFIRLSVQMWLLFVWFLPNTEAVKCIADFVWYHSSEQRPGQPAPRDFTAWPTADCAWIVSWKDSHARRFMLSKQDAAILTYSCFVYTGRSAWSSYCRICSQERELRAVSSTGFRFFWPYWRSGGLCKWETSNNF